MDLLTVENLEVARVDKTGRRPWKVLLKNINLSIPEGKITCLIGESGSGKSIFSRTIAALLPETLLKTRGTIAFKQNLVKEVDLVQMRGEKIFYAPQNAQASLNPVIKIIHQYTDKRRIDLPGLKDVMKMLNFSDPQRILHSYPFQLSGGENQRCLLAMALLGQPELLILDEPTSGLDEKTQQDFLTLLIRISHQTNLSVLLITHRLGMVRKISDFTYVIYQGQIVDGSPAASFLNHPAHEYSKYLADNLGFF